jgi:hypothetical protein
MKQLLLSAICLLGIPALAQQAQPNPKQDATAPGNEMMCMGPGGMRMQHGSGSMADMGAIHQLMVNHDRITRTVTILHDGVRTVTESDDPQIAKLIKEHVGSMSEHVSAQEDPGMPMESADVHAIMKNGDKIETKTEMTEKGAVVVQTSADAEMVAALQRHAAEVTDLVKGGMAAMHSEMMKNRGANGQSGMQCPMMRPAPDAKKPQDQK